LDGLLRACGFEGERIDVSGPTQAHVRDRLIGFHFCPTCGCVACWRSLEREPRGRRRIAVNLRLAEPDVVAQIPIDHFDGLVSFDDQPRNGRRVVDYWF
jgi:hypothetical protein